MGVERKALGAIDLSLEQDLKALSHTGTCGREEGNSHKTIILQYFAQVPCSYTVQHHPHLLRFCLAHGDWLPDCNWEQLALRGVFRALSKQGPSQSCSVPYCAVCVGSSHLSLCEPVAGVGDVSEVCISQRNRRSFKLLSGQAAAPCEEEEGVEDRTAKGAHAQGGKREARGGIQRQLPMPGLGAAVFAGSRPPLFPP